MTTVKNASGFTTFQRKFQISPISPSYHVADKVAHWRISNSICLLRRRNVRDFVHDLICDVIVRRNLDITEISHNMPARKELNCVLDTIRSIFEMAERMISITLLDDITECSICTESYSDPRSLPCVHTFCLNCIAKWSGHKLPGDGVDCPLCRKEFKIPDKGIGELPKNIFIGKLLSMKCTSSASSAAADEADATLCDWCVADSTVPAGKISKAMKFCVECQESLCERCCEQHSKTKICRSHNTVSIEEKLECTTICLPTVCDEHKEEKLKLYCLECREALCILCFVTKHNGHKSAEIAKVASELRHEIRCSNSELAGGMNALEGRLKNLQDKRQDVINQFCKGELEVCACADELQATIERHKQQLLTELGQKKAEQLKKVDTEINENKQNKSLLESLMKYSEELLKKGSDSDIARESRSLTLRSAEMKNIASATNVQDKLSTEAVITFQPSDTFKKNVSDAIGILNGNIAENGVTNSKKVLLKGKALIPTLRHSLLVNTDVCALTSFNNQLFVTRFGTKRVEVYDTTTFKPIHGISIRDAGQQLLGLAACSTHACLYVSDYVKDKVRKVNLSDSRISASWSVCDGPYGLSVNKSRNLLVAFESARMIKEYTTSGSPVREIASGNSCLSHVIELNDGTLAVSEAAPFYGVSIKSVDGKVLRRFGSRGLGPIKYPRSLVVDSRGFILVADSESNKILVLNPQLTDARILPLPELDEPLIEPTSLCYEESRGRLYVGEDRGRSRILAFDNVFNVNELFNQ